MPASRSAARRWSRATSAGARRRSASACGWAAAPRPTAPTTPLEAIKQLRGNQFGAARPAIGSPYQLTDLPLVRQRHRAGQAPRRPSPSPTRSGRTLTYCGDKFGQCLFSKRQAADEGLPVVVVDEEIYRRLPTLLIATVDKFAQMPWKGEVQMLFGQVNGYLRAPRLPLARRSRTRSSTPRHEAGLPAAKTVEHTPLRPPDLIIQDELHLISGPLGTLVGLYETAIDRLCTWEVDGKKVRPKVVASTATIKSADVQVHKLFLRTVNVFPPHGLDVRDNFFSLQREPIEENPGRLLPRHLCHRAAAQGGADPGLHRLPLLGPGALREVRQGRRSVDDAGRLLQLDAGTRRDAPPGGRRRVHPLPRRWTAGAWPSGSSAPTTSPS